MSTPRWVFPLLVATSLVFAAPLVLLVLGSLKSGEELARNPYGLFPETWAWSNYREVFTSLPLATYLRNTLLLCVGCVTGSLLSCSLVAYSLSRIPWLGSRWLFATVLMTLLLPWQVTMIPRFVLISELGLYNSLWAIILPCLLGDAFYIFLLRQFFLSLPQSLLDAGRLDGLGHWGLFWRIVVPLSYPALVAVGLFQFIETWNNFGGPLLYLNDPEKFPLASGLERFVSAYGDQTHLFLAAATVFTLPAFVLFLLAQRHFLGTSSSGGIKG